MYMSVETAIKLLVWCLAGIAFATGAGLISLWWQLRMREAERDQCDSSR
jgi:hypothetical protein